MCVCTDTHMLADLQRTFVHVCGLKFSLCVFVCALRLTVDLCQGLGLG